MPRTVAHGATREMDWEQESETRDRRLCHSQQHRILGAEEKLGKESRGHICPWTCLFGMSVSPPHSCIQSPVLTGTRRKGLSIILRTKMDLSLPPLGPGCHWLPVSCCSTQEQTPQPLEKQCSIWVGQAHHSNAHQPPPQVPHTALHTAELCFSKTLHGLSFENSPRLACGRAPGPAQATGIDFSCTVQHTLSARSRWTPNLPPKPWAASVCEECFPTSATYSCPTAH